MKDILLVCDYGVTRGDKCTLSLFFFFLSLSLLHTLPHCHMHTPKKYITKDKVQEKQNIHITGSESLLDTCYNDIFVHSQINLGKDKWTLGPGDHAKQERG